MVFVCVWPAKPTKKWDSDKEEDDGFDVPAQRTTPKKARRSKDSEWKSGAATKTAKSRRGKGVCLVVSGRVCVLFKCAHFVLRCCR